MMMTMMATKKRLVVLMAVVTIMVGALATAAVPAAFAQQQQGAGVPEGAKTISFDLTVQGTPPADATFFAQTVQGISVQLIDPNGDGMYTGSLALSPQNFPEGAPLKIVQGTGTATGEGGLPVAGQPGRVIKDFGLVTVDEDKTLSASVSFPADNDGSDTPGSTTGGGGGGTICLQSYPAQCVPAHTGSGGSGTTTSSSNGSGSSAGSGQYTNSGGNGTTASSGTSGSSAGASSSSSNSSAKEPSGPAAAAANGVKTLPSTGGILPIVGVGGALLVGGGLLIRRLAR